MTIIIKQSQLNMNEISETHETCSLEELEALKRKLTEDLEEGECSDDEAVEEAPESEAPKAGSEARSGGSEDDVEEHRKRGSKDRRKERHRSRKHRKRDGERRRDDQPLDEESKKRHMLKKLKALEGVMGIDFEESEEEEGEATNPIVNEEFPNPAFKRKREKSERPEMFGEWKRPRFMPGTKSTICSLYMQGKCPKSEGDCMFSHDAEPPQVWELCKFYMFDRCAKKEKCLYLHKGFPCKYFHTGMDCQEDRLSCKFSHEPLNEMTRGLLLKHLELAPKELLGDFPRMTRIEAQKTVSEVESKRNGWTMSKADEIIDKYQKHHKRSHSYDKWETSAETPLAVQQAMAIEGRNPDYVSTSGLQCHDVKNARAFKHNQTNPRHPNFGSAHLHSCAPTKKFKSKPTGLMDVVINEEMVHSYLKSSSEATNHQGIMKDGHASSSINDPREQDSNDGGDETPEITPPTSRESSPKLQIDSDVSPAKPQFLCVPSQPQRKFSYSSCDDEPKLEIEIEESKPNITASEEEEEPGTPAMVENLPSEAASEMTAIKDAVSDQSGHIVKKDSKDLEGSDSTNDVSKPVVTTRKRQDPRLARLDPRKEKQGQREGQVESSKPKPVAIEEEKLEKEKDRRIMDLDFGSVFGDLELPPLVVSPRQSSEETKMSDLMGLPFKPHIYNIAKEIKAGLHSHPPMEWILRPISVPKPDYSKVKLHASPGQIEMDPRLRRYNNKSSIAKIKELPLPNVPAPRTDPRRKDPRQQSIEARRRLSEDSESGQMYNPAKDLIKVKQDQNIYGLRDGPNVHPAYQNCKAEVHALSSFKSSYPQDGNYDDYAHISGSGSPIGQLDSSPQMPNHPRFHSRGGMSSRDPRNRANSLEGRHANHSDPRSRYPNEHDPAPTGPPPQPQSYHKEHMGHCPPFGRGAASRPGFGGRGINFKDPRIKNYHN